MKIQLDEDLFHQISGEGKDYHAIVMTLSADDDSIYRFDGVPAAAIDILATNNPCESQTLTKKLKDRYQSVPPKELEDFIPKFLEHLDELGLLAKA